jgi:class 3 adenylate cyclase
VGLASDLSAEIKSTFTSRWEEQTATTVPAADNLRLNANHAKDLETATVLYADLDGSTNMVDNHEWWFSAEIYKAYLRCAGQIIRSEGGTITAYDGDRIMAVYTGSLKNTSAVRAALKINWAVHNIIRPALKTHYQSKNFTLNHVVGVDTSQLRAARIGVRGDNDLVWVGRAANYAAKLTSLPGKPIWISKAVFDRINNQVKLANGAQMWEKRIWKAMNNMEIYCSTYTYRLD